jgi:hypothetical protein
MRSDQGIGWECFEAEVIKKGERLESMLIPCTENDENSHIPVVQCL